MKKGTVTVELNGYRLVVTIAAGGRRYFSCDFPEIAERFDGTTDPGPAMDRFEELASAQPPEPAKPRTPSLFDAIEEGIAAGASCEQNAVRQGWDSRAASEFIVSYLARHGPTSGEVLVSEASKLYPPHDGRAFGPVFARLKRRGVIVQHGHTKRAKGHGAPGLIWSLAGGGERSQAQEAAA